MTAFTLQAALDVAERRTEAKSRAVKLAYVAWLNARTHLVRLEQQRQLYGRKLSGQMQRGCSTVMIQAANSAMLEWQARLTAAQRDLDSARQGWQEALDAWQVEQKRVEALLLLARRQAQEERKREERRERRLHDELSSRSAYARGYAEQADAGLLQGGMEQA